MKQQWLNVSACGEAEADRPAKKKTNHVNWSQGLTRPNHANTPTRTQLHYITQRSKHVAWSELARPDLVHTPTNTHTKSHAHRVTKTKKDLSTHTHSHIHTMLFCKTRDDTSTVMTHDASRVWLIKDSLLRVCVSVVAAPSSVCALGQWL